MTRALRYTVTLALLVGALAATARDFSPPKAYHAKTYPARDVHDDEQLTIAADPYDLQEKAAPVFTVDYLKEGMLPIQVIFSNDGDSHVSLAQMSVTFLTRNRDRILPAETADVYRRISKQVKRGDEPKVMKIPLPGRKKGGVNRDSQEEVEAISVRPKAIEPKTTLAAIYVFDVNGLDHPLAGAKLILTGIRRDNHDLFYFEIPMEKYLSYSPTAGKQ